MSWLDFFSNPEMYKTFGMIAGQGAAGMNTPFAGLGGAFANYLGGQKYAELANQQAGHLPSKVTIQFPDAQQKAPGTGAAPQPATPQPAPAPQPTAMSQSMVAPQPQSQVPQMLAQGAQTQNFLSALLPLWQ